MYLIENDGLTTPEWSSGEPASSNNICAVLEMNREGIIHLKSARCIAKRNVICFRINNSKCMK